MTPIFDIKELIALMRAGTSEEAIPHLEYITQKLPTHVAAHALLAQAYTNEGRLGEAKLAWQNALFLMPNSPSIKKGFRRVLRELSKQQPAVPPIVEPELKQEPLNTNGQHAVSEEEAPSVEESNPVNQDTEREAQEEHVSQAVEEVPSTIEEPELISQGTEAESSAEESELVEQHAETEESAESNELAETEESAESNELVEQHAASEAAAEESERVNQNAETEQPVEEEDLAEQDAEQISAPEGYIDGTDQAPSNSEETPSMLVNPSSHHDVTPVEIEAISPKDLGPPEIKEDEHVEDSSEVDDLPLPVITVPTPNSTPTRPPSSPKPHVPPILAPLIQDSDEWAEDQELDHLIEELESARIIPKPDHEHIEAPVLEDNVDDMVSETLARIYEGQKQYGKAADMYEKLATIHPERTKKFEAKAAELRALLSSNSDEVHGNKPDES